jgi:hypothetical protein
MMTDDTVDKLDLTSQNQNTQGKMMAISESSCHVHCFSHFCEIASLRFGWKVERTANNLLPIVSTALLLVASFLGSATDIYAQEFDCRKKKSRIQCKLRGVNGSKTLFIKI